MTNREFYLQRQQAELPEFLRVFRALDYRPDERSPSGEEIVWLITRELQLGLDAVTTNRAEWRILPPPPMPEMLETFEKGSLELLNLVSRMPERSWDRVMFCRFQGTVILRQPIGRFLWTNLFDAIHHRSQLAGYVDSEGANVYESSENKVVVHTQRFT